MLNIKQTTRSLLGMTKTEIIVAILFVYLLLISCHFCPDLAIPAFSFKLPRTFDSLQLRITLHSDKKTLKQIDLGTLFESHAGRYNMEFYYARKLIGELYGICTQGALKGCEAEQASTEVMLPLIEFIPSADKKWQVRLIRNGKCPAD